MVIAAILFLIASIFFGVNYLFVYLEHRRKETKESAFQFPPKPTVAFPFEPLTELVEECANTFSKHPFESLPAVRISPEHYFSKGSWAFFDGKSGTIYLKDSYANNASPDSLTKTTTAQLLHAWLWFNRDKIWASDQVNKESYQACFSAMTKILAIEVLQSETETATGI